MRGWHTASETVRRQGLPGPRGRGEGRGNPLGLAASRIHHRVKFHSKRHRALLMMADGMRKLNGPNCFYCAGALNAGDVDHFVPFSHYSRVLAHNLVLAHPFCNRSKSATLRRGRTLSAGWSGWSCGVTASPKSVKSPA